MCIAFKSMLYKFTHDNIIMYLFRFYCPFVYVARSLSIDEVETFKKEAKCFNIYLTELNSNERDRLVSDPD